MATPISADKYQFQLYKQSDSGLIPQIDIDSSLTGSSFIEFSIFDLNDELLYFTNNYKRYTVLDDSPASGEGISQFDIDPDSDVLTQGYDTGEYVAYYNFVTNRIGSQFEQLYISEISSDRTELRLDSTVLSNFDIEDQTENFIDFREENIYFTDFQLNFGTNQLVIANNIKLDSDDDNNPTILIKLYEPLPQQFEEKSLLYIVTALANPEAFRVQYTPQVQTFIDSSQLQGPNFSIPVKNEVNNSSLNLSENDILSGGSTGSYNELQGLLSQSSINISIDYNNYNEFIHFSSAQTRLENFYYKASLLEQYSGSISSLQSTSGSSASITLFENKISSIITNFDGYDKFLYYQSGSKSWPKTNSTQPYELAKTGSIAVREWYGSLIESDTYYGGQLYSASFFDNQNPDQLLKSIPEYLREDTANQPYELFVDMVAQYYDNVWLYTKDVTQKYNADNRLDFGISKDLVSDAIKDFGVKLYQNNFSNQELYTAFLGMTPNGSLFPFPEITGSMPVPTGYEFVDTMISASNDVISMDNTNKSLYKRIYHNIPYLLNKKGTIAGLRALITTFGIPDTILRISEFGGKDKVNANDWDLYRNTFNYAFDTNASNYVSTPWRVNSLWSSSLDIPNTVQFRFRAQPISSNTSPFGLNNLTQTLWRVNNPGATNQNLELVLNYTGSGLDSGSLVNASGSYNGSIKDPYYQYAKLDFYPDTNLPNNTASVYLPFMDGEWWSVMIQKKNGKYELQAANKIYNGNTGTKIGFEQTSTVNIGVDQAWTVTPTGGGGIPSLYGSATYGIDPYGSSGIITSDGASLFGNGGTIGNNFSGSLQEIRYFKSALSQSVFRDYTMNPLSFESNGVNTAPDQLIFRASLGGELNTLSSSSIHPKTTGSWAITSSFSSSNNSFFGSSPEYLPNAEYFFLDQPAAGIKNRINDKVRWESNVLPGNTLSQYRKISQTTEASASYSENINYLEVAFSPQNQINDDIIGQMGHFNIGDYIGDPRQRSSRSIIYPDLNNLSEEYFKKYIKQYDLVDFVRLIKFFDNSLFKMIKDFIPARTSLASGLVVKQHLLERNKYPQPQMSYSNESELSGSIDMVEISGGPAGVFNEFNGTQFAPGGVNNLSITQSWSVTTPSLSGSVTTTHSSQDEFYNGELSGSIILVTDGELNEENSFKQSQYAISPFGLRWYGSTFIMNEERYLNGDNEAVSGYMDIWRG